MLLETTETLPNADVEDCPLGTTFDSASTVTEPSELVLDSPDTDTAVPKLRETVPSAEVAA
jgi:hypothetical protein